MNIRSLGFAVGAAFLAATIAAAQSMGGVHMKPGQSMMVPTPGMAAAHAAPGAEVDGAKIAGADSDPGEWLSHGRTYPEQRFSPLSQINTSNVKSLGVAWEYRTYSVRGLEATPIVANGVMFITLNLIVDLLYGLFDPRIRYT